jgi:Amt family ammonium transporter
VATWVTGAAALAWVFVEWALKRKPSVLGIISGAVAGLVAITPAAGFVDTVGAFAIGIAAGVICFFTATSMKRAFGYDDSLDAFGVHGIGGIVGALLTGVFAKMSIANSEGAFAATLKDDPAAKLGLIEGNVGQVLTQLEGVGFTVVWCAVITFILLKIIDLVIGLRVDEDIERDGLDIALHGESIH